MKDEFGDRMKEYESINNNKLMNFLPVYARIDGRSFSKFTKGLDRPFDRNFHEAMIATAEALVKNTHADMAFTQSDEISLLWTNGKPINNFMFAGKVQKLVSVLSGIATSEFQYQNITRNIKPDARPHFDARIMQVPNTIELYNMLLWRQKDAARNAVSMTAQSIYSHKKLHKVSTVGKLEMIDEAGSQVNPVHSFGVVSLRRSSLISIIGGNGEEQLVTRTKIVSVPALKMFSDMVADTYNVSVIKDELIDKETIDTYY